MLGRTYELYLDTLYENQQLEVENRNESGWKESIIFLSPFFLLILFSFLIYWVTCAKNNAVAHIEEADEDEMSAAEVIPVNEEIEDDSFNEAMLLSVGLEARHTRDHRTLGFFYDFKTMNIPDEPVMLNTGDIVSEDTAKQLIRTRSRLPRGEVVGFYKSPQLKGLLDTLVKDEVSLRQKR